MVQCATQQSEETITWLESSEECPACTDSHRDIRRLQEEMAAELANKRSFY